MATYQNYILYRTVDYTVQGASYTDATGKSITPAPVTVAKAGAVVSALTLSGTDGLTPPAGFAYALDAAKAYPVGSIYTPPATTETATTAATS